MHTRADGEIVRQATPLWRALVLLIVGGLVVSALGWTGDLLWGQKLDVERFRADSISRDAVDREILDQSTLTAARVKAMYCATIPEPQQAGCN